MTTSSEDTRIDVPSATRPPSSVLWAARLWRGSAAVRFLTTLWELLIARLYLDVLSNGEVGAAAVAVLVVVAVVVATVAVGYWTLELRDRSPPVTPAPARPSPWSAPSWCSPTSPRRSSSESWSRRW
jgi:hypothetical protein